MRVHGFLQVFCGRISICSNSNAPFLLQACDLGSDLAYPTSAAGWLDDPTGSFDRNNYTAVREHMSRSYTSCQRPERASLGTRACNLLSSSPVRWHAAAG
jgi:hypothetical protein